MSEPRTLCELFQFSLEQHPREIAYLRKVDGAYRPASSREVADRVQAVSTGLRQIGVHPGDRVAIVSENRLEWAIADYAILHCGAVTVPVYPTLQAHTVQSILRNSGAMAAFVSDSGQLAKLGSPGDLPRLRQAIVFDPVEGHPTPAEAARPAQSLGEFDSCGVAAHDSEGFACAWRAVRREDLATIIYTSGTTGEPKGVMLTHGNIVSNVLSTLRRAPISSADGCLSFLPLSHILERMAGHFLMWHVGATVAFAESIEAVPQNLVEVRPTVLVSVPRLYEKMYARVLAAVEASPHVRQQLFAWARGVGREVVRRDQAGERLPWGLALQRSLADRLVFAKLRGRLGGRMRLMISGGAPLSRSIAEFFFAAGLPILEGYGLTETSPVLCVNPPARPKIGYVGPPVDGVELRLAEQDEIVVRGPNVMRGYWENPRATAEVLRDGWLHTGDVGEMDTDGYVRITDRIKDLIVTAGGKKVAPQPIESRLKASQYLAEAILVGDERKYLTALIVPNFANLEAFGRQRGIACASRAELAAAPEVVRLFEGIIGDLNAELASFERIKRFRVMDRELDTSGELTPSMKVKRSVVSKTLAGLIESMYQEPPPPGVGCPPTGHGRAAIPPGAAAS